MKKPSRSASIGLPDDLAVGQGEKRRVSSSRGIDLDSRVTALDAELALYRHMLDRNREEFRAFAYTISHDLRAPIRAIEGFSKILLDDFSKELGPDAKNFLDHIVQNSRLLSSQLDDLLKFYRLGNSVPEKVPVNCDEIFQAALAEQRHPNRAKVSVAVEPLGFAMADPTLLRQAFAMLLDNAFKFSLEKDVPRLEVRAHSDQTSTTFYIKDNGIGFDMQYASKLFHVFQKLHSPQEYPGNGIGLAMVKRIADLHGGCVAAEAEPEKGATFSLTLPGKCTGEHAQP
ncbi:MAG: sensor histidine kinase [Verrucomicrobiota bacterium]